jgi:hypothetical protein
MRGFIQVFIKEKYCNSKMPTYEKKKFQLSFFKNSAPQSLTLRSMFF